jgi:DNA-binding XRE family transcriptional regulator
MSTRTSAPRRKGTRAEQRKHGHLPSEIARLRTQPEERPNLLEDPDPELPALPPADERGHYPAVETARVIIARQIIRGRKAAGWTQAELASRAGVRQETISRLETGKHSAGLKTMAKIEGALEKAGV